MKLLVFSHKECWRSSDSTTGWATDGGFAMHMDYLAKLFESTQIFVPEVNKREKGEVFFTNSSIRIIPLKLFFKKGIANKLFIPFWVLFYLPKFLIALNKCDAVHAPIPSNIGTIGFLLAHLFGKPLYIRHCGNWYVQKTMAERFWKWYMIKYAGNKKVFLTTGGSNELPSIKNKNIKWIFSSSLTEHEIDQSQQIIKSWDKINLAIVCRQEIEKGVGIVIESLSILKERSIILNLNIVGDGPALDLFKKLALKLNVNSQINFHGKLNHEQVLNVLSQSHIFCYPTFASEGFPKVVLEAMSQGLVIVTTPVSVLENLIPDKKCGILLKNLSPELLANEIQTLISDLELMQLMSKNAIEGSKLYSLENWSHTISLFLEESWKTKLKIINS